MALLSTVAREYVPSAAITTVLREQLYEVVSNVDPFETQVLDLLPQGASITSPIYQFVADSLPALKGDGTVGAIDIDGINYQGITEGFEGNVGTNYPYTGSPERLTNFIQLFAGKVQISDTLKNAQPNGIRDPYNWEKVKVGRVMKKAIERRLFDNVSFNASYRNGTSSDPRAMKGFYEWTSGNYVLNEATANSTITPTLVDTVMKATIKKGGAPRVLAMGPGSKLDLSIALRSTLGAAGGAVINTSNINATERRIIRSVDFYDGDFGSVAMVWSRNLPESTSTTGGGKVWAIEPEKVAIGDYSPMQHIPLAKTGHNTKGIVVHEVGYMFFNPRSWGVINNVTTTNP